MKHERLQPPGLQQETASIERILFLRQVPLFHFCTTEEILSLEGIVVARTLKKGEVLFQRGDRSTALYCVWNGKIRFEQQERHMVEEATAPMAVGHWDVLRGDLRLRTAVAVEPTEVLEIPGSDFLNLLASNVELMQSIFRRLTNRILLDKRE
jgi:CRP-like cAMP-binding protein